MPIYEYECKDCGKRFEKMQPITSEPLKECLYCGKPHVRRVFQPVGVIFKGSGWYINDSRPKKSGSDGEAGKPAQSEKSETSGEKPSDNSDSSKSNDSSKSSDSANSGSEGPKESSSAPSALSGQSSKDEGRKTKGE